LAKLVKRGDKMQQWDKRECRRRGEEHWDIRDRTKMKEGEKRCVEAIHVLIDAIHV
jgi:hypothetical protein